MVVTPKYPNNYHIHQMKATFRPFCIDFDLLNTPSLHYHKKQTSIEPANQMNGVKRTMRI